MSDLEKVKKVLEQAKQVFTDYAKHHARKNDPTQDLKVKANTEYAKLMNRTLPLLESAIAEEKRLREKNKNLKGALEYVDENYREEDDIKKVVQITLEKRPKIKVTYSNIGKYFADAFNN